MIMLTKALYLNKKVILSVKTFEKTSFFNWVPLSMIVNIQLSNYRFVCTRVFYLSCKLWDKLFCGSAVPTGNILKLWTFPSSKRVMFSEERNWENASNRASKIVRKFKCDFQSKSLEKIRKQSYYVRFDWPLRN